ncbi:MAG TPA: glycosyltransferase [Mycobacteriales bacterium]|nr:glycosyltransferase [Mycobacteriales bacterium]
MTRSSPGGLGPRRDPGMRIALVGPTAPYKGGIAQHTTELAHRLAAEGHLVRVESWSEQYPALLYPGEQRAPAPERKPFGNTAYDLAWYRPDSWLRVGHRLRSADLVVVVLVSPVQVPAYLALLRALHPGDVPVVVLAHNVLPHERRAVDVPLVRALLRRADAVLAHSDDQAALARSLADTPVTVTALAPFPPAPPSGPARPPGAPPTRTLLFFGLVRPYKGLDVLLRALAAGPPDVRLVVAGEFWGGTADTERLVAELGIEERVELRLGYVPAPEVAALFARADALVLPYRTVTGTQHTWLAFAHGLPVVAARVGTLPEQVRDGVDGLLCDPGDVAGLADALCRLYEPGCLPRLRANVHSVDPTPQWREYVAALVRAGGGG